jgi:hypothetical protein
MNRISIFILVLVLISCKPAENPKMDFLKWVKKGEVSNNVVCKNDQSLGYCLYVPKNYNIDSSYAVIYCFDPKGDGRLPVILFKNIAEEYGYIVVGSNSCRNGLQPSEIGHITDILLDYTKTKLSIDTKRIYLAGFSGGARVACSMALNSNTVAGVIACSAGFDPTSAQGNFNFIGIAGNEDMNYLEMKQLESSLVNWQGKHQFIVFNGKHQWPPQKILEQAISTLELFSMKEELIVRNEKVIRDFISERSEMANHLERENNIDSLARDFQLIQNMKKSLYGLANVPEISLKENALMQSTALKSYIEKENEIEKTEAIKQQTFVQAYTTKQIDWWKKEIKDLHNITDNKKDAIEERSARRLLAFICLMSYSYVNSALSQQNFISSGHFLQIYGMADPENPDYLYFSACFFSNTGNVPMAFEYLKKAISFGFGDKAKLENDPLLANLRSQSEFAELLKSK